VIVVGVLDGTTGQAGVLVALASFLLTGVATQSGRVTATFASRITPLVVAALCLGSGTAIVGAAPNLAVVGVGVTIAGFGTGLFNPLYRSYINHLASQRLRGGLVSIAEAFAWFLVTLAPVVWGISIGALDGVAGQDVAIRWTAIGLSVLVTAMSVSCLAIAARATRG
jgi:hypothetical protein